MASKGGIRAGRAYIELGVNDGVTRGLQAAEARLRSFGAAVNKIGAGMLGISAGITGPLAAAVKIFSDQGDAAAKMAKRTGVGVEALQEIGHAAGLSGSSIQEFEKGILKMSRGLVEASRGMGTAKDSLAELGLSAETLIAMAPDEAFKTIADRIAQVENPTRKAALAMEIFGKSGAKLIPLLDEGRSGIEAMQREASALGFVLSAEAAASSEVLNDDIGRLQSTIGGVVKQVGAALAPAVSKLLQKITPLVASVSHWVQDNHELIVTIAKVGLAIGAAGAALITLGTSLSLAGFAAGGLATLFSTMVGVVAGIGSAMAALVSPIGLVATALVGGAAALVYYTDVGAVAIGWLREQFAGLQQFVGSVVGGISDALAAGDIQLAATVLWKGLMVAWEYGTLQLRKVWETTKGWFIGNFYDMLAGALNISQTIFHGIEVAWIETTSFMSSSWTKFTSFLSETWLTIANILEKTWNRLKGIFDSTFDAAAANLAADQAMVDKLAQNESEKQSALSDIEARRAQQRESSSQVDAETRNTIEAARRASEQQLNREGESAVDKARRDFADALREYYDTVTQARQARENGGDPGPGIERPKMPDFDAIEDETRKRAATVGAFNVANLANLFSTDDQRRTADGIDRLVKLTETSNQLARAGGRFL